MPRRKITDGSKLKYAQLPIMEKDFKTIGKERLEVIFKKAVEKEIHNIEKGKVPNQINLIDSIAEIEQQIK
jgi:hypothetical protein